MRTIEHVASMRWAWITLILVTALATSVTTLFALNGFDNPPNSAAIISLSSSIAWSWWVHADRVRCHAGLPFEFDAFVFFAWPFLVPYYLIRTRKSRAATSTVLAWGVYALPFVVALCVAVISVLH